MSNSSKRKVSPLLQEKWLLSELSDVDRKAVEAKLSAEERAALLEEDRALRTDMLEQLPARVLKARVQGQLDRERSARRRTWFVAAPALAAALGALLLFVQPGAQQTQDQQSLLTDTGTEREKGLSPRLVVFRQLASTAEQLKGGDEVKAHDLLQLGYVAAGRPYGVLLSIDGSGVVTLHSPRPPQVDASLKEEPKTQLLSMAYELDDAPRFERFFFVTSRQALRVESVLVAAERLASDPQRAMTDPLVLGANIEQASLLLKKTASRAP